MRPGHQQAKRKKAKKPKKTKKTKNKSVMKDRHLKSKVGGAGGGSANDVARVHYKNGIGDSGATDGFFKSDWDDKKINKGQDDHINMPGVGYTVGIEETDARNAARAVASSRVDRALGTNVVSKDHFAKHDGEAGVVSPMVSGEALAHNIYSEDNLNDPSRKEAVNQSYVTPESAKNFNLRFGGTYDVDGDVVRKRVDKQTRELDTTNANVQQGMMDLQLNDYLTGQVARHAQNIFADEDGQVTGIDNDLAFGTDYSESYEEKGAGMYNMGMPNLIDGGTAERIQVMEESEFQAALVGEKGDLNHLNDEEIEGAMQRFRKLKAHVEELLMDPNNPDARVIYNWGGEGVRDMMIEDGKNYLARHAASYAADQAEL
jgi:hypothetical protein